MSSVRRARKAPEARPRSRMSDWISSAIASALDTGRKASEVRVLGVPAMGLALVGGAGLRFVRKQYTHIGDAVRGRRPLPRDPPGPARPERLPLRALAGHGH